MSDIIRNTTTITPLAYQCPSFPSLYWLVGPPHLVKPAYLYNWRDIWRFTFYWTLIIYEAAHLLASTYAVVNVWWGSRHHRTTWGMGRKTRSKRAFGVISGMWAVPIIYCVVAGIEAALAGSVVGLMYDYQKCTPRHIARADLSDRSAAIYNAGGFRMSTWIPFVWSLASLLIVVVSSFSIQGGL